MQREGDGLEGCEGGGRGVWGEGREGCVGLTVRAAEMASATYQSCQNGWYDIVQNLVSCDMWYV